MKTGFKIDKQLTVSHFRVQTLKKAFPLQILVPMDSMLQWTGKWIQVSPSVFVRSHVIGFKPTPAGEAIFQCPRCHTPLPNQKEDMTCEICGSTWPLEDGIYDFRIK